MRSYRLTANVLFLLILLPVAGLQAETKIAVLGFRIGDLSGWPDTTATESSGTAVASAITELKLLPGLLPVDRTKLLEQIKEMQLDLTGLTGMVAQDAALKIQDADFLFIGSIESPAFEINRNDNPDHMSDNPVEFQGKIRYQLNMEIIDKLKGDVIWSVSSACTSADYTDERGKIKPGAILQRSLKTKIKEGMKNITPLIFQSPEITKINIQKKTVRIGAGRDFRIKKGLLFSIYSSINGRAVNRGEIKIDKVMGNYATGTIVSGTVLDPLEKYFVRIKN